MSDQPYFPESKDELTRLEFKTDRASVIDQARWAGLSPGMRVLDVGCGPGITTCALAEAAAPGGRAVGIDRSDVRIAHAKGKYASESVEFSCRNFFDSLEDLGQFDFVWMRFVAEYFLKESGLLIKHVTQSIKPGGILCLADLDHNCMNHHGHSERLEKTFRKITEYQMTNNNFDPYAGRRLPTRMHELGCEDIRVDVRMHHLVYGELSEFNRWNWWQKIELAAKRSGWTFEDYEDGFAGFEREFVEYFNNPQRFVYTPLVIVRGVRPANA
ncbi:MAG: methyltransferase domain-containing protein [Desulfuromonadales bacterium]|nr:methyltransferase domain-containing protein [Desulfuromonadales bacterium]